MTLPIKSKAMKLDWNLTGHSKITESLEREIKEKRLSHAYLFSGPENVGKIHVARKFAQALGGTKDEGRFFKDDGESLGIDEMRQLLKDLSKSSYGQKRVIIIENAERMTIESENSILKLLEEPPKDTVIIFTTRNYFFLLPTIISRMRVFHFHLEQEEILKKIADESPLSEEEKEESVQIANGRVGVLNQFIENPDFLFKERELHRRFEKMSHGELSVGEVFDLSENLNSSKNPKKNMKKFFESLLFFLRFKILKNARRGEREKVLLGLKRLEYLKEAQYSMMRNANLKLVIENLILSF